MTVTRRPAHHHPHAHHPAPEHDAEEPRQPWSTLVLALTAQLLVVLDISVVNTALPTIGRSLQLRSSDLQWLVTAYLLLSGGMLLFGGRVADLVSRRRVFLTGMAIFTGASLASGFAAGATQLIAARGFQGLGAALMTPAALSLIMTTYSGAQRNRGLALWGAAGSLSIAVGVLVGGALTTWAGWQLIFWVNVPIGVVTLVAAARILPRDETRRPDVTQFDVPGAVSAIAGVGALMFGLSGTSAHGWLSTRTLVAFGLAAALLTGFVLVERRAARPLVPPHTWKIRTLVSSTGVMLGVTGILVGTVFLMSIFFQTVLGYTGLRAGLAFLPLALSITVGTHVTSRLQGRATPRTIASWGLALAGVGALVLASAPADAGYLANLLPGFVISGVGFGMVFVAVAVTAMAGIPPQHAGMASGFLMTGHELGAALGVAVLSAIAVSAGDLTTAAGVVEGSSRGFTAAAVIATVLAAGAFWQMPATRVDPSVAARLH
jgi:EmrB/QacA subfamily drug resistance transporter